jgi:N-carbamoyl-L-amino-acid hydrolase
MDMRAPLDPQRDALEKDVLNALDEICSRRGLVCHREAPLRAPAAPSAPEWQARWEKALKDMGVPRFVMPSGAGHDAMKLHEVMPQAMLFVRGENSGISHNPLESSTTDDMQLCIDAFEHVWHQLA